MVVRSGEDTQAVCRSDGGAVDRSGITKGSGVSSDGSLLHIISDLTTNHKTLVTEHTVTDSIQLAAGLVVKERAGMEHWLLEVQVHFLSLVTRGRVEVTKDLSLQALSEGVVQLDLGV